MKNNSKSFSLFLLMFLMFFHFTAFSQKRKLVILGTSTAAGTGSSPLDSSWVNCVNGHFKSSDLLDSTYNLAVPLTSCYNAMPSGYNPPVGRPFPDAEKNITKAVTLLKDLEVPANGVIIINFPAQGYENYSVAEVMYCLRTMYNIAIENGNKCYITTTQPRSCSLNPLFKKKLSDIKDSVLQCFGSSNTINFWDGMYDLNDTTILPVYAATDLIHFNNTGHRELYKRVIAKNIFAPTTPLMLGLRSFEISEKQHKVVINWSTAGEIISDYFTVERSRNGLNFEAVSMVEGAGNCSLIKYYSCEDQDPFSGTSYYRLKQTNTNGVSSYSHLQTIKLQDDIAVDFSLFPNPGNGNNVNINLDADGGENFAIVINDIYGKECYAANIPVTESGTREYSLDLSQKLSIGVYTLKIIVNDKLLLKKMIVE